MRPGRRAEAENAIKKVLNGKRAVKTSDHEPGRMGAVMRKKANKGDGKRETRKEQNTGNENIVSMGSRVKGKKADKRKTEKATKLQNNHNI